VKNLLNITKKQNYLKMYKVTPSLLDKFRTTRAGLFDKPIEELISYIKGEFIPSPEMEFGTSIHRYFETGNEALLHEKEIEQLRPFYKIHSSFPKEIANKIELLPGIIVSSKADELIGHILHEFKTGQRFWGVNMYDSSIQWKVYCLLFESPKIVYHHFAYYKPIYQKWANFSYRRFSFYAYVSMERDIKDIIDDFIEFVKVQGLEKYITI